jgi:hypothetical protein
MAMFNQQAQTLQMLATLIAGLPHQTASAVAPPIVTVVAAQTDAKKVAFQRVRAILQLFDPDLRALAWKVTETDQAR